MKNIPNSSVAEQLHDFDVAPGGKYIVGVEPMEALDGVVTSFENAFDTHATSKMSALGMFVAELNQQQVWCHNGGVFRLCVPNSYSYGCVYYYSCLRS
jgi:hypothetical protein